MGASSFGRIQHSYPYLPCRLSDRANHDIATKIFTLKRANEGDVPKFRLITFIAELLGSNPEGTGSVSQ